jgi:hypothetical protein
VLNVGIVSSQNSNEQFRIQKGTAEKSILDLTVTKGKVGLEDEFGKEFVDSVSLFETGSVNCLFYGCERERDRPFKVGVDGTNSLFTEPW